MPLFGRRELAFGEPKVFGAFLIVVLIAMARGPAAAQDDTPAPTEAPAASGESGDQPSTERRGRGERRGGRRGFGRSGREITPEMREQMRARFEAMRAARAAQDGQPPSTPMPVEKTGEGEQEKKDEEKKPEGSKEDKPTTTKRPDSPRTPPDPNELKVLPDEEGKVRFNFRGQPWDQVLQWLADTMGLSLDWQETPAGYLNLTTQRSYTLDEARDLINQHLLARGFSLVRTGEVLSVVNLEKLNPALVPRVRAEDLDSRFPHELVAVSFQLDTMLAEHAANELKPMLSQYGKLTPLKATNRLEAIGAVNNLRDIRRLLEEEQSDRGKSRVIRTFVLHHTAAAEVKTQLMSLLGIQEKQATTRMTREQMRQAQQMAQMQAQMAQQMKKAGVKPPASDSPKVQLVVLANKNSILAHAPPDKMSIIEKAVEAIDIPTEGRGPDDEMNFTRIYRLANMAPEPLVTMLRDTAGLNHASRLQVDADNKAVVAYASLEDHEIIRALIDELDGTGRQFTVIRLDRLKAEKVAKTISFLMLGEVLDPDAPPKEEAEPQRMTSFFDFGFRGRSRNRGGSSSRQAEQDDSDKFRVEANPENNSLWVWANRRELREVESLLDKLRRSPVVGETDRTHHAYRLTEMDPQALVTTLNEMDKLHFSTQLQVDAANKSIVAYAVPADHVVIKELIDQLDGSGRRLEVVPLRRLEADYVAGTIEFLLVGPEETPDNSRNSRYSYYPYTEVMRPAPKSPGDTLRVDANLESNELLLWVNDNELEQVQNLLVQLGEIPAQGTNASSLRTIELPDGPEAEALLERIRRAWPSLRNNPLLLDVPAAKKDESSKEASPKAASDPNATGEEETEDRQTSIGRPSPTASIRFVGFAADEDDEVDPTAENSAKVDNDVATDTEAAPADTSNDSVSNEKQPAEAPPAAAETTDTKETTNRGPPPVTIMRAPDGRLIITSQDTEALDDLEALFSRMSPRRQDYKVFHLKHAGAIWVKMNLEEFFEEEEEDDNTGRRGRVFFYDAPPPSKSTPRSRLSKRRPLKFVADVDTNTILVQGADANQLATIADLIDLYDVPEPVSSQMARVTQLFPVKYSKASIVAATIKDAYRDLLSANDKALANGQKDQKQRQSSTGTTYITNLGGDDEKAPKRTQVNFKGKLSIGIDDATNTLLVSAEGEGLLRTVGRMIQQLDEAAKPLSTVRVVHLKSGIATTQLKETLNQILSDQPGKGKQPQPNGQQRPNQQNQQRSPMAEAVKARNSG